jgi:hypothetical protein
MRLNKTAPQDQGPSQLSRVRSILNGAKTLEPLLLGLLRHPGLAQDEQRLSEATKQITDLHREVTKEVHQALLPEDDHPAARATFAASLAHLVGQAWSQNPEGVDPKAIAGAFLQTVEYSEPRPDLVFEDLPRATDDALAKARAVSHCIPVFLKLDKMPAATRGLFVGQQSSGDLATLMRGEIESRARKTAEALLPPGVDEKQAQTTFKSVMGRVASVTAQILEVEYASLGKELQAIKSDPQKRTQYMQDLPNHPRGVLIDRTLEQVDKTMGDLFPLHSLPKNVQEPEDSNGHCPS